MYYSKCGDFTTIEILRFGLIYRMQSYIPHDIIKATFHSPLELPFMLYLVCKKNGYKLFKNLYNRGVVYDENGNKVFAGTVYQASQEFLKLTSKGG